MLKTNHYITQFAELEYETNQKIRGKKALELLPKVLFLSCLSLVSLDNDV
jgi:hypothetical protein